MAYIKQNSEGIETIVCANSEPIIGEVAELQQQACIQENPTLFTIVEKDLPIEYQKLNYSSI